MLEAEITAAGDVLVEGQHVGRLQGFQFAPDPQAGGPEAKALKAAAVKALAGELDSRANRLSEGGDDAFVLSNDGALRWIGEVVGKLAAGEKLLEPRIRLLVDEHLSPASREKIQARVDLWLKSHVEKLLGPLVKLEQAENLSGIARGIAFQIGEALGVLERSRVAEDMKTLDQEGRAALRNLGVRFGAYHLTVPALLKPAPRSLAAQLWALKHGGPEVKGLDDILHLAASGRTSIPVDKEVQKGLYRAAGFRVCGERAVRVDILERLADLIRPAIHYRPGITPGEPPAGTADGEGFIVTTAMTSLCGCAGEDFASILRSLGYVSEKRTGPAISVPLAAPPAPAAAPPESAPEPEQTPEPVAEAAMEAEPVTLVAEAIAPVAPEEPVSNALTADEIAAHEPASSPEPSSASAAEGAAAVEPESSSADAAEPVQIEIWSQRRHQHGPRQGRRDHRGPRQQTAQGAPGQRQERGPRPQREGPRREQRADGEGGRREGRPERPAGAPNGPRREDRGRPERAHGREGHGHPRGPRPEGDRPFRERRPEKQPDPDSPFAKLLALKAELEARKGKS